jgi:hypothetical protein
MSISAFQGFSYSESSWREGLPRFSRTTKFCQPGSESKKEDITQDLYRKKRSREVPSDDESSENSDVDHSEDITKRSRNFCLRPQTRTLSSLLAEGRVTPPIREEKSLKCPDSTESKRSKAESDVGLDLDGFGFEQTDQQFSGAAHQFVSEVNSDW